MDGEVDGIPLTSKKMKGGFNIADMDFKDITYLMKGNQRQRDAYTVLTDLRIMERLREFDPILVGTIPIALDLPDSDLDIICCVSDYEYFQKVIASCFRGLHNVHLSFSVQEYKESLTVQFTYNEWLFEIFAQPVPTVLQNGYRHMIVEHRILEIAGDEVRQSIIKLKQAGLKTEPAFAKLLGIEDEPFAHLLMLSEWSDDRLRTYVINNIKRGALTMNEKEQMLEQYSEWIDYVMVLKEQDETLWNQSMGEGKWLVRDVVSHIMKWDEYFQEGAILRISRGEELKVKHLDYDSFNEIAKTYGRTMSIQQLIEQTLTYRQNIIDCIKSLSEEEYTKEYVDADGHPFQVPVFIRDFIWHDQHHMNQMKSLMNNQ